MNDTIFRQKIFPIRHKMFRFALRITGSTHEAEDVVQEVLEKVWQSTKEQSEFIQNWEAWCMTMTRNRSLDKTRSMSYRRTTALDAVPDNIQDATTPSQSAEQNDLIRMVKQFMQELPEKQRLVMHLRDIEELSYEEIADTIGISLDQVKVNLHRARKQIREKMLGIEI